MVILAVFFFFLIHVSAGVYGDQASRCVKGDHKDSHRFYDDTYPGAYNEMETREMSSLFFPFPADTEVIDSVPANHSVRIDGVVQGGDHWIVWINGYKVTPVLQHPQFEVLTVASDLVQLRHRTSGQVIALTPGVAAPFVLK